jgi:hypothetical protein
MPVVAVDPYPEEGSPTESAGDVMPVTPSDSDELPFVTKAISFGGAGAITYVNAYGVTRTIPSGALATGVAHPMRAKQILDTGTDATQILAWMR